MTVPNDPDSAAVAAAKRAALIRLSVLKQLEVIASTAIPAAKAAVKALSERGETMRPTVDPDDPDDRHPFAVISHTQGSSKIRVKDPAVWLAWVKANYPTEVLVTLEYHYDRWLDWLHENGDDVALVASNADLLSSLSAWADHDHPTPPTLLTERVAPAFMTRIDKLFDKHGKIIGPKDETDIPGLVIGHTDPTVSVSLKADRMPELWAAVRGDIPKMLEERT